MSKEEALQEFLNSFEGSEGNRDGKASAARRLEAPGSHAHPTSAPQQVTMEEWIRHYEEVSCSIDNDDHFGTLMATTWSHLKQKLPDGTKARIRRRVTTARDHRPARNHLPPRVTAAGARRQVHRPRRRQPPRGEAEDVHLSEDARQLGARCRPKPLALSPSP